MGIQDEQVGASPLVGASQTTLHSHPGGGGGADVKSGIEVGVGDQTQRIVTFNTAFATTPNVVTTLVRITGEPNDVPTIDSVTTTSFRLRILKHHGGTAHTWDVHWIATDAGNP